MRSRSVNMRREAWKYQNYFKFLFERNIIFPFCIPPSTCPSLVSWSHRIGMNGAAAWQRSALFVWKHQNKCPVKLFSYEPWKFDGLIKRGDGVVGENLQSNLPIILSEDLFKGSLHQKKTIFLLTFVNKDFTPPPLIIDKKPLRFGGPVRGVTPPPL